MKPAFSAGWNIAMKIPAHEYASTVDFYRNVLGLKEIGKPEETPRFEFGDKVLWLDCVSGISQAEIWLEILTDDIDLASAYFKDRNCVRRDEIEPLPEGMKAFWLSSPYNIIHLVKASDGE